MRISVVIISFNGEEFIDDCLSSVKKSFFDESYEIIIVDNGSEDQTLDIIKTKYNSVKLIENQKNLGFAKAVNQGINASCGEYILLLNQDTRIRNKAIGRLAHRMESDKTIGTIGPRMIGFDGKLQHSCRAFPKYKHLFYELTGLAHLFPRSKVFGSWRMGWFDHASELAVDQPIGAALMVRREVIEKVGLFDEQFRIFFNDVDYCRRVKESNYINLFYPGAEIEHYYGGSIRQNKVPMIWESHRAMILYFKKYSRSLSDKLLLLIWRPILYIAASLRALLVSNNK